ncbi:MAG: DUF4911 domain-containing protein [Deltaproteobacteria bacterium]|nr:DUF4911 domain-containing protein [Deltaproteobacteria bacterium]
MAVNPKRSDLLFYRVDPYEIHYLKFILEAYEGLATLTTLDSEKGLIQLAVPPGRKESLESLVEALGRELVLERVADA